MKRKNEPTTQSNKKSKESNERKEISTQLINYHKKLPELLQEVKKINSECEIPANTLLESIQKDLSELQEKKYSVGNFGVQGCGKTTLLNVQCSGTKDYPFPTGSGVDSVTNYPFEVSYLNGHVKFQMVLVGKEERTKRLTDLSSKNMEVDPKKIEEVYSSNTMLIDKHVKNEEEALEVYKGIHAYLTDLEKKDRENLICIEKFVLQGPVKSHQNFIVYDTPGIEHQNQIFSKEMVISMMKRYMNNFDVIICPLKERQPTEMLMSYLLKNFNIYEKCPIIIFALNVDTKDMENMSTLEIRKLLGEKHPNIYSEFVSSLFNPELLEKVEYFEKTELSKSLLENIMIYPLKFFENAEKTKELYEFLEIKLLQSSYPKIVGKISSFLHLIKMSSKKVNNQQLNKIPKVVKNAVKIIPKNFIQDKLNQKIRDHLNSLFYVMTEINANIKHNLKSEKFFNSFFKIYSDNRNHQILSAVCSNIQKIESTDRNVYKMIEYDQMNENQKSYYNILNESLSLPVAPKSFYEIFKKEHNTIDQLIDQKLSSAFINELFEDENFDWTHFINTKSTEITSEIYPMFEKIYDQWEKDFIKKVAGLLTYINNERKDITQDHYEKIIGDIESFIDQFTKFAKENFKRELYNPPILMKTRKDAFCHDTETIQSKIFEKLKEFEKEEKKKKNGFVYQKKDDKQLLHNIVNVNDNIILVEEIEESWGLKLSQNTFNQIENYSKRFEKWFSSKDQKNDDVLAPIFIPSIVDEKEDFQKFKVVCDNMDGTEHLKFLIIEPSQKDLYTKEYGEKKNIIYVVLPQDNIDPAFTLNMINMISRKFKFSMVIRTSQYIDVCSEFYFSILESKNCSFARAFLWCQKILASIQRKIQKELIELIQNSYEDIKNHLFDEFITQKLTKEQFKHLTDSLYDSKVKDMRLDDLCELILDLPKNLELYKKLVEIINKQQIGGIDMVIAKYMKIQNVQLYPEIFFITKGKSQRSNVNAFCLNLITSQNNHFYGKYGVLKTFERESISNWEEEIEKVSKNYQGKLNCKTLMFINFGFNKK